MVCAQGAARPLKELQKPANWFQNSDAYAGKAM
jgi:hypothetical protein